MEKFATNMELCTRADLPKITCGDQVTRMGNRVIAAHTKGPICRKSVLDAGFLTIQVFDAKSGTLSLQRAPPSELALSFEIEAQCSDFIFTIAGKDRQNDWR